MKLLFLICSLLFSSIAFAGSNKAIEVINCSVLKRENIYYVSLNAPSGLNMFKFALYRKLKNGNIAIYKLSNNRTNFVLVDVYTRAKLNKVVKK